MDFYLHRSTTYRTTSLWCRPGRAATASFTLSNETPVLPAALLCHLRVRWTSGRRGARLQPERSSPTTRTPGATIRSVTLDGKAAASHRPDSRIHCRPCACGRRPARARAPHPDGAVVQRAEDDRGRADPAPAARLPAAHSTPPARRATRRHRRRRGPVGVWPVVVGVLLLLAAGAAVATRRRLSLRTARAKGTDDPGEVLRAPSSSGANRAASARPSDDRVDRVAVGSVANLTGRRGQCRASPGTRASGRARSPGRRSSPRWRARGSGSRGKASYHRCQRGRVLALPRVGLLLMGVAVRVVRGHEAGLGIHRSGSSSAASAAAKSSGSRAGPATFFPVAVSA